MDKRYDIRQRYSVAGTVFHTTLESNLTAKQVIEHWPTVSLVGNYNDAGMCAVPYVPVLLNHYEPPEYPTPDTDMPDYDMEMPEVSDDEY